MVRSVTIWPGIAACISLMLPFGNAAAHAQAAKKTDTKGTIPKALTPASPLPKTVRLDFPLPSDAGIEMGSTLVQRPGTIGMVEAQTRAPGGPYWEELQLLKEGKPVFEFGFLLGLFSSNRSFDNLRVGSYLRSISLVPEKCSDSLLTFRLLFKSSGISDPIEETGEVMSGGPSPIVYSNSEGWKPLAFGVTALDVSLRRGTVNLAYDPYELSLISERSAGHELSLFYVAAMRLPKSRRYLIDPNRLFQILTTYKVVPDVNEPTSFGETSKKRFTAIANLINSEMANWDQCLYDVLEPETDTEAGLHISGAPREESSIPKPGQLPEPPRYKRIEPQRIFRKVRLPAHELALVKRLEAMKTSGASDEQIRVYRAFVNRVLLDRLLVDNWDKSGYHLKSSIVQRGITAVGVPDLNRLPYIAGTDIPSYVPAPTELLRMTVSIPKEVIVPPKKGPAGASKRPFVLPDDFNPLTHEVVYDKEGNIIGVRRKTP